MAQLEIVYFETNKPKPRIERTDMLCYIEEQREPTVWTGVPMLGISLEATRVMPGHRDHVYVPWHPKFPIDEIIRNILAFAGRKEAASITILMPKHFPEAYVGRRLHDVKEHVIGPAVSTIKNSRRDKVVLIFASRGSYSVAFEEANAL